MLLFPPVVVYSSLSPLIHSKYCCDSNEMCSWQSWAKKKSNHFSWFQAHAHRTHSKALDMTWWNISIHVQMKCYSEQCNSHTATECNFFFQLLSILFPSFRLRFGGNANSCGAFVNDIYIIKILYNGFRFDANDNRQYSCCTHQRTEKLWTKWQI